MSSLWTPTGVTVSKSEQKSTQELVFTLHEETGPTQKKQRAKSFHRH